MSDRVPYGFATKTLVEVKKPQDFPAGKCYVIEFHEDHSVHHEGDERSRTHPGHGYPAYTETFHTTRTFVTKNEQEWKDAIQSLYVVNKGRTDIVAFIAERATIQTQVLVGVSTG